MIRNYSNTQIYKNFRIVKILSLIAFILSLITVIPFIIIMFIVYSGISERQIFFCVFAILGPLNQLLASINALKYKPFNIKQDKNLKINVNYYHETKFNNDFSNILVVIIVSILLSPNILVYIADGFLIHNCVLIKREWKDNPPNFVIEQQAKIERKRAEIYHKNQEHTMTQNLKQYEKLIEQCGIKFFIKYYKQIKRLPLRDVTVVENYTPTEKEERLLAAKKIIELDLTELALTNILNSYSDILDTASIEQAKILLSELKSK